MLGICIKGRRGQRRKLVPSPIYQELLDTREAGGDRRGCT